MHIKTRYIGFLLLLPVLGNADDLRSLLDHAHNNNKLVLSKGLSQDAKEKELQAKKSDYFPTVDLGGSYQSLNARSPYMPGDVYGGYAKIGMDLYDGGRKSSLVDQKKYEYQASGFDLAAMKKSVSLQIIQDFFTIKSLEATLLAREEAAKSLDVQLKRMQQFYTAMVATKDDVDRLQSAYDKNIYEIESVKLQILSLKRTLELKVGKTISALEDSKFKEMVQENYESVDSIKSLTARKDAVISSAESVNSVYYPQLRLEDTYSVYGYERTDALHPEGAQKQNKLMLSLNIRLFDMGTAQKEKAAVMLNSQALNEEIAYQTQEQKIQYELALSRIQTSKIKIRSASSALVSAQSAFKTIEEKYNAGIVDNVVYLDALATQTEAKALYQTSLNDIEIAYAVYYYYAGKNIEEFLQ